MRSIIFVVVSILAVFVATSLLMRNTAMTENEKCIKEAEQKIKEFEAEKEPERLRESAMALENIVLAKEYDAKIRRALRTESLTLWLTLVQILDNRLDPNFDPEDVPEKSARPPLTSRGEVLRPGIDPAKIADPTARAEYEKAIAENREKQDNYRMQFQLGRLNEFIPPRAENFIRNSCSDSDEDQKELTDAIEEKIEKPERKEELMRLVQSLKN